MESLQMMVGGWVRRGPDLVQLDYVAGKPSSIRPGYDTIDHA